MQVRNVRPIGTGIAVLIAACCLSAQDQPPPAKEAPKDTRPVGAVGLPPRVSPTDYQASGKAGVVTIAGDFTQHSVPTPEQLLTTEDYVVVEVALYGPPEARSQISLDDFTLRINSSKKPPLHAQSFVVVLSSIKDPEWSPPESQSKKSSTSFGTGGNDPGSPPPVVHVPIELQRAMAQHIQKASLPLGDRVLPQAGLLFFQYHGKAEKINSVELSYAGPAGKVTLDLQP